MPNARSREKEGPGQAAAMNPWQARFAVPLRYWGDWWLFSPHTPWALSQQQQKQARREMD